MEKELIKGYDIIMMGLQPWDIEIGSNFKNMALELSLHNRILYVNRALDRASLVKYRKDKKIQSRIKARRTTGYIINDVQQNVWAMDPGVLLESINWIKPSFLFDYCNRINNKRLAKQVKQVAAKMGFKNYLLMIDNDFFRGQYMKEYLQPRALIYYIRDYLNAQPYFAKHGKRLEPALIKKADLVICNSAYLAKYAAAYNPHAYDTGQGCELENFVMQPYPVPAILKSISKPIIGYTGAILHSRLDEELLLHIAANKPGLHLVLVGPEDDFFKKSKLHNMNNVHFTGPVSPVELPAVIHHFDVCINPQQLNELTIGNYPRKADEYLAMGKPLVATATDAMELFAPYTFLCKTKDEYLVKIEEALKPENNSAEICNRRRAFALTHTWANCIAATGRAFHQLKNSI
jgi:glycosyltransferase involved in cell wall biosynthesis